MHRFCSRACVNKLTGDDNNSQDLTPSSLSISASSQTMVIDLAQRDQEDNPTPNCNIPDTIVHLVTPNTTDPIWTAIHKLESPVAFRKKKYNYICTICTKTKTWQPSLWNASNAKSHLMLAHKSHELAMKESDRRKQRAS
ncbi:hypothetical protein L917_01635 [Phytophthora nicotianae]|uniref:Uncharacterized protein n=1 Tax=Phytophthora nicotianae TaxID=4792 RepID=W2LWM6_PHYNI|nr:hypothetical protein L917_01635 [Phytophthora nicotianae]